MSDFSNPSISHYQAIIHNSKREISKLHQSLPPLLEQRFNALRHGYKASKIDHVSVEVETEELLNSVQNCRRQEQLLMMEISQARFQMREMSGAGNLLQGAFDDSQYSDHEYQHQQMSQQQQQQQGQGSQESGQNHMDTSKGSSAKGQQASQPTSTKDNATAIDSTKQITEILKTLIPTLSQAQQQQNAQSQSMLETQTQLMTETIRDLKHQLSEQGNVIKDLSKTIYDHQLMQKDSMHKLDKEHRDHIAQLHQQYQQLRSESNRSHLNYQDHYVNNNHNYSSGSAKQIGTASGTLSHNNYGNSSNSNRKSRVDKPNKSFSSNSNTVTNLNQYNRRSRGSLSGQQENTRSSDIDTHKRRMEKGTQQAQQHHGGPGRSSQSYDYNENINNYQDGPPQRGSQTSGSITNKYLSSSTESRSKKDLQPNIIQQERRSLIEERSKQKRLAEIRKRSEEKRRQRKEQYRMKFSSYEGTITDKGRDEAARAIQNRLRNHYNQKSNTNSNQDVTDQYHVIPQTPPRVPEPGDPDFESYRQRKLEEIRARSEEKKRLKREDMKKRIRGEDGDDGNYSDQSWAQDVIRKNLNKKLNTLQQDSEKQQYQPQAQEEQFVTVTRSQNQPKPGDPDFEIYREQKLAEIRARSEEKRRQKKEEMKKRIRGGDGVDGNYSDQSGAQNVLRKNLSNRKVNLGNDSNRSKEKVNDLEQQIHPTQEHENIKINALEELPPTGTKPIMSEFELQREEKLAKIRQRAEKKKMEKKLARYQKIYGATHVKLDPETGEVIIDSKDKMSRKSIDAIENQARSAIDKTYVQHKEKKTRDKQYQNINIQNTKSQTNSQTNSKDINRSKRLMELRLKQEERRQKTREARTKRFQNDPNAAAHVLQKNFFEEEEDDDEEEAQVKDSNIRKANNTMALPVSTSNTDLIDTVTRENSLFKRDTTVYPLDERNILNSNNINIEENFINNNISTDSNSDADDSKLGQKSNFRRSKEGYPTNEGFNLLNDKSETLHGDNFVHLSQTSSCSESESKGNSKNNYRYEEEAQVKDSNIRKANNTMALPVSTSNTDLIDTVTRENSLFKRDTTGYPLDERNILNSNNINIEENFINNNISTDSNSDADDSKLGQKSNFRRSKEGYPTNEGFNLLNDKSETLHGDNFVHLSQTSSCSESESKGNSKNDYRLSANLTNLSEVTLTTPDNAKFRRSKEGYPENLMEVSEDQEIIIINQDISSEDNADSGLEDLTQFWRESVTVADPVTTNNNKIDLIKEAVNVMGVNNEGEEDEQYNEKYGEDYNEDYGSEYNYQEEEEYDEGEYYDEEGGEYYDEEGGEYKDDEQANVCGNDNKGEE